MAASGKDPRDRVGYPISYSSPVSLDRREIFPATGAGGLSELCRTLLCMGNEFLPVGRESAFACVDLDVLVSDDQWKTWNGGTCSMRGLHPYLQRGNAEGSKPQGDLRGGMRRLPSRFTSRWFEPGGLPVRRRSRRSSPPRGQTTQAESRRSAGRRRWSGGGVRRSISL